MLIDLFVTDLVAGYKELKTVREALMKKWRFELLRAYTRKYEAYTAQLARQEARRLQYQRSLPFIGIVLLLVCGVGAWLTFRSVDLACLGMMLMLGTGFAALLTLLPFIALSRAPQPPENPVTRTSHAEEESPLQQKLFPRLLPLWRQQMAIPVPSEVQVERMAAESGKWGLIGEFDLIRALEQVVSPDTYILHSLKPRSGDDLDVVVLGPKGFWYFEVKHWNAHFIWQNSVWQVLQYDYTAQGLVETPLNETPDAQWNRMKNEALANLKTNAADLLKRSPVIGNIQGGIVFSNLNAVLEIERTAPFRYGTVEQWVAIYQAAPRLKDMTAGRTLQLLEGLLKKHQSFYPDAQLHSMRDAIANVIAEVEQGIQGWMESA
jgi:hypothetical protein